MIGDPERYVKSGSSVALRCVVRGALEPPSYIIWYHDTQQLLSENQQKWEIKLSKGTPDADGDIPNIVSTHIRFLYCFGFSTRVNLGQYFFYFDGYLC